jgi:hypothetical protein
MKDEIPLPLAPCWETQKNAAKAPRKKEKRTGVPRGLCFIPVSKPQAKKEEKCTYCLFCELAQMYVVCRFPVFFLSPLE